MDTQPNFGPSDERSWDRDISLSWSQERWPTRRGWAVALALTALIPALYWMPLGFIFFGPPAFLGVWHVLKGQGPLITPAGQARLRLAPDKLVYDVTVGDTTVTHFEMDRAAVGHLELRMMDKANTAISVTTKGGRSLELGERRLDPRIEGRHLLLSTWLASWWPDVTTWHERLGPRGLALLDASRSRQSAQAIRLRRLVRRAVRLGLASVLVLAAWVWLLQPDPMLGTFHPFGDGHTDLYSILGLLAAAGAVLLLVWPSFATRRDTYIPEPHAPGRALHKPLEARTRVSGSDDVIA